MKIRSFVCSTIVSVLVVFTSLSLHAQQQEGEKRNFRNIFGLGFSYGFCVPGADFADRFGAVYSIGFDAEFITEKNSFIFGIQNRYLFGGNVKEDVLASLRTENGVILGINEQYTQLEFKTRGFYTGLTVGKIFAFQSNSKSGLRISVTAGLLEHHIKINDLGNAVPQINPPYNKGYDRKTIGFSLQEFVGYQHMGLDNKLNVFAGLEFTQGFGKNVRPVNFDTQLKDETSRTDIMIGIRAGFILPLFSDGSGDEVTWY